jgi:hypothetical protein
MTEHPTDPRLARVLGPEAPEVSCDECFERLDAYVELEARAGGAAAEAAMAGLAAHLRGCPACAEDHESLRDFVAAEDRGRGRLAP